MRIEVINKDLWQGFSENAHKICFQELRSWEMDRIDFTLFAVTDGDEPAGYITCREWDKDTLYWQFGGVFPSVKNGLYAFRAYQSAIDWAHSRYKRITTLIENTNAPMLKMAAKVGFRIVGVKNVHDSILVEHLIEF